MKTVLPTSRRLLLPSLTAPRSHPSCSYSSSSSSRPPSSRKPTDRQTAPYPSPSYSQSDTLQPQPPQWRLHQQAIRTAFPTGWNPPIKLSRPAMSLIRALHKEDPVKFSTGKLAGRFMHSPEGIRRVLKGRWRKEVDGEVEGEEQAGRDGVGNVFNQVEDEVQPARMGSRLGAEWRGVGESAVHTKGGSRSAGRQGRAGRGGGGVVTKEYAGLRDRLKRGLDG